MTIVRISLLKCLSIITLVVFASSTMYAMNDKTLKQIGEVQKVESDSIEGLKAFFKLYDPIIQPVFDTLQQPDENESNKIKNLSKKLKEDLKQIKACATVQLVNNLTDYELKIIAKINPESTQKETEQFLENLLQKGYKKFGDPVAQDLKELYSLARECMSRTFVMLEEGKVLAAQKLTMQKK